MTLLPVRSIEEYVRLKQSLRDRFENEKTGEQGTFEEQKRLFQPLLNFNEDKTRNSSKSLLPFTEAVTHVTKELKRRNDRVDMLAELPFFGQASDGRSTITWPEIKGPERKRLDSKQVPISVNLDKHPDKADRKTLSEMGLPLPSEAFEKGEVDEVLRKIKRTKNSLVQKISKISKAIPVDRAAYEKQKDSLVALESHLLGIKKALVFVNSPKKTETTMQPVSIPESLASTSKDSGARTRKADVIFYRNSQKLGERLVFLVSEKKPGNNGVENEINAILDELLRIRVLTKKRYDGLYKEIFS